MEEQRSKRSRDRDRADPPEGNQDGYQANQENQEGNPKEQTPDNPEPEEFIDPEGPTTPPSPTTAEWIEHQITHIPFKPW